MPDARLRFEKTGRAVWISHLDLMRTMQRAFLRAGVRLEHTQGFNPHPYMTFALPLSVGVESVCEMVDVRTDWNGETLDALNRALPEGIRGLEFYAPSTKFRDLVWLRVEGIFLYDGPAPAAEALAAVFDRKEICVHRKTKRGEGEADIRPMIREIGFRSGPEGPVLSAVIAAQNPSLNPALLTEAIRTYAPALAPAQVRYKRLEVLAQDLSAFR